MRDFCLVSSVGVYSAQLFRYHAATCGRLTHRTQGWNAQSVRTWGFVNVNKQSGVPVYLYN